MTIIQSTMDYGLTVWGNANQENIQAVQRLQSRCARLLTGYFDHDISSLEILAQLRILNVTQRYQYFMGTLIYKCIKGIAPNYLSDTITCMQDIHEHNTRNEFLLRIPPSRTNYGKRSLASAGSQLWNSLPYDVQSSQSVSIFKRSLRNYIL